MSVLGSLRRWLRPPSRVALILGLGALSTTAARADVQGSQTASGDVLIRSDGGKIFLSEGGQENELLFGATRQRERLLRLLEEHGRSGVELNSDPRLIMSGGGGTGFSLWDLKKSVTDRPARPQQRAPRVAAPAKRESAPHEHNASDDKKE